jgi:metallo-beta-lactamase family protein
MLRDCAYIQEKEAEWKNKKGQRTGKEPVTPLYTLEDAEASLSYISPLLYDQEFAPVEGIRFSFVDAGHILGSAISEIWVREGGDEIKIVYSGDLGVDSMPLLCDPVKVRKADVVIMETTYGARLHEKHDPSVDRLFEIIKKATKRGGTVLIPSFAVGRTQEILYELNRFFEGEDSAGAQFRNLKVYVDSPMASAATDVFRQNTQDFDAEYKSLVMSGSDPLDFENLAFTRSTDESKTLNANREPKIIISASGMCEAGRILHHLKHRLWDPKSVIVFVGFQAEGTLGRRLIEGAKTVSILGEAIDVNAEIVSLEGFSAHADRDGLLEWAKGFDKPPAALFLVHGEAGSKAAFAETLRAKSGLEAIVIEDYSTWTIEPDGEVLGGDAQAVAGPPAGGGASPVDPEDMERLLAKLRNINDNVEGLLYRAKLATVEAANGGDADSYTALKNIIASLESDTSKLAGELAGSRRQK